MKRKWRLVYLGSVLSALVIGLGLWSPLKQAVAKSTNKAPRYQVDPFWPKPLPIDIEHCTAAQPCGDTAHPGSSKPWVTGEVAGTCVDSKDHIFTVNRGPQNNLVSPEGLVGKPSPSVIEYDRAGNVVNAWPPNVPTAVTATNGGFTAPSDPPGCDGKACHAAVRGVPTGLHGCFVDHQDNVWIAGNGDGIVQKYTHDGSTLLLQIGLHSVCDGPTCGTAGSLNNSRTLLNQPADVAVDPNPDPVTGQRGSIYIADGYGNHRVVVFDRNGNWLRHWGGIVQNSANPNATPHDRGSFANSGAGHPHCVVIGNDGLLYVCDRADDRIQVFEKSPTDCTSPASVWVPGVTPVCQPRKIITVVPGTGMTAGKKKDGTPTTPLNTAGSAWDVAFSVDKDQTFMFEADGGDEIVWEYDHALAIADQATPCTTMECGTWPRAILAGFGRPGHMAGDFTFLHTLAVDSRGNLFTGETINGRRVQRFELQGGMSEKKLEDFHPSGYPALTLKHYDPRFPGGRSGRESDDDDDD